LRALPCITKQHYEKFLWVFYSHELSPYQRVLFAGRTLVVLREFEIGFSGLGLRPEVKIISLTDNGSVLCRAGLIARSDYSGFDRSRRPSFLRTTSLANSFSALTQSSISFPGSQPRWV